MASLSFKDRETYRFLRERNLLKDVDAHRIDMLKGTILVPCADGDQFDDVYADIAMLCLEHRPAPRICLLSQHGGALVVPHDSPLNRRHRGDNLVEDVCDARREGKFFTVALCAHAPCAAAAAAGLGLLESINLLVRAKVRLKTDCFGLDLPVKVACFMHIDDGSEAGKKTFFVSAAEWQLLYHTDPKTIGETLRSA